MSGASHLVRSDIGWLCPTPVLGNNPTTHPSAPKLHCSVIILGFITAISAYLMLRTQHYELPRILHSVAHTDSRGADERGAASGKLHLGGWGGCRLSSGCPWHFLAGFLPPPGQLGPPRVVGEHWEGKAGQQVPGRALNLECV